MSKLEIVKLKWIIACSIHTTNLKTVSKFQWCCRGVAPSIISSYVTIPETLVNREQVLETLEGEMRLLEESPSTQTAKSFMIGKLNCISVKFHNCFIVFPANSVAEAFNWIAFHFDYSDGVVQMLSQSQAASQQVLRDAQYTSNVT